MQTRVQKWGDSLVIPISYKFAQEANLEINSTVDLLFLDGTVVIKSVNELEITLEKLLGKITEDNLHSEVETNSAIGNEIW
jgi:antitoxin MazE